MELGCVKDTDLLVAVQVTEEVQGKDPEDVVERDWARVVPREEMSESEYDSDNDN